MKTINVEIQGITPYLMQKFSDEASLEKKTRRIEVNTITPREQATKVAYIANDGTFYFSAASIPGCMRDAGSNHKMKGSRRTLRFIVPSAIRIESDAITLLNCNGPIRNFEVDSRPVTIPSTKGKVMKHRPRFDQWRAEFRLLINDDLMSAETAHQLLNEAGITIGIGDYRPAKGGPFGTFRVTRFEEL